jgi:hypothetical protein
MLSKVIYVASPYNHPDDDIRYLNFLKVSKYSAKMISEGHVVISPIAYGHPLLSYVEMPYDFEFWSNFCLSLLNKCDEIHVLTLDGWDKSRGVLEEIQFAKDNLIPVEYIEYVKSR